jgi:hypothetical protein
MSKGLKVRALLKSHDMFHDFSGEQKTEKLNVKTLGFPFFIYSNRFGAKTIFFNFQAEHYATI